MFRVVKGVVHGALVVMVGMSLLLQGAPASVASPQIPKSTETGEGESSGTFSGNQSGDVDEPQPDQTDGSSDTDDTASDDSSADDRTDESGPSQEPGDKSVEDDSAAASEDSSDDDGKESPTKGFAGKGDVTVPRILSGAAAAGLPSAGFKAGYILSDANMYDGSAMTAAQIQSFLNTQVPRCTIGDPGRKAGSTWGNTKIAAYCLQNLKSSTQSKKANAYCKAYQGAKNETAAQIIAKVGKACGISPKVLLVRLQLEQNLVLDTWPTVRQFSYAMGWNCPDSGPGNSANCNNGTAGFLDQVYGSAWQVKRYKALPNEYNYKAKKTNTIQWHPDKSCGTSQVYIENDATAALYIYTPYRPNQAALNAGWNASSNKCATYGNRNFYQYYRAWFGSPNSFFSDVQQGHKFFKEIEWMGTSGLSTGITASGEKLYRPQARITREAMAAFLYRMEGANYRGPKESPFSDVNPGDDFYNEITWMHSKGYSTESPRV